MQISSHEVFATTLVQPVGNRLGTRCVNLSVRLLKSQLKILQYTVYFNCRNLLSTFSELFAINSNKLLQTTHDCKEESNPVVGARYIPQEMLRQFIHLSGVVTCGPCFIEYISYASQQFLNRSNDTQ